MLDFISHALISIIQLFIILRYGKRSENFDKSFAESKSDQYQYTYNIIMCFCHFLLYVHL